MGQPRHPLGSHNAIEVEFVGDPRQQNFQSHWSHEVSDVSHDGVTKYQMSV